MKLAKLAIEEQDSFVSSINQNFDGISEALLSSMSKVSDGIKPIELAAKEAIDGISMCGAGCRIAFFLSLFFHLCAPFHYFWR